MMIIITGMDQGRYGTSGKPSPFADRWGEKTSSADFLMAIPIDIEKPGRVIHTFIYI